MLRISWATCSTTGGGTEDAISQWEASVQREPEFATVWRNLGIAYFNVRHDQAKALDAFDRAHSVDANDARILYERDQLWKRVGKSPEERLETLQTHLALTFLRDDLTVEFATLLNQTGEPEKALHLLTSRIFQPWEGGEGLVLAQFVRSNLLLGRRALLQNDPIQARRFFEAVLSPPQNLGEAKHLLANWSDVFFWIGVSYADEDRSAEAAHAWQLAARQRGDFQQMSVRSISDMTFWTGMAYARLGHAKKAREIFQEHLRLLPASCNSRSPRSTTLPPLSQPCCCLRMISLSRIRSKQSFCARKLSWASIGRRKQRTCLAKYCSWTETMQAPPI